MIRSQILGIPLLTRISRRYFVVAFWLVEASVFVALSRFPIPMEAARTPAFLALLGFANSLPLLLGGFSVGGAVAFYEGKHYQFKPATRQRLASNPERARLVLRFLSYYRPADEREAQLRDAAHHRSHRVLFWVLYLGTMTYLIVSAVSLQLLARFGFAFLDMLLVATMSLPQSILLWSLPEVDLDEMHSSSPEAQCEPN